MLIAELFFFLTAFFQIHPNFPLSFLLAKDQCTYCISEVKDDFCPLSRSVPSDLKLLKLAPCPIQSPTCFLTQYFLCQRTNCFIQKMEIDGESSLWQLFQYQTSRKKEIPLRDHSIQAY